MLDESYKSVLKLIGDNREKLDAVVSALLERETLSRTDFVTIMEGKKLPPMSETEKLRPAEVPPGSDPIADDQREQNREAAVELDTRGGILTFLTGDGEDKEPFLDPKE